MNMEENVEKILEKLKRDRGEEVETVISSLGEELLEELFKDLEYYSFGGFVGTIHSFATLMGRISDREVIEENAKLIREVIEKYRERCGKSYEYILSEFESHMSDFVSNYDGSIRWMRGSLKSLLDDKIMGVMEKYCKESELRKEIPKVITDLIIWGEAANYESIREDIKKVYTDPRIEKVIKEFKDYPEVAGQIAHRFFDWFREPVLFKELRGKHLVKNEDDINYIADLLSGEKTKAVLMEYGEECKKIERFRPVVGELVSLIKNAALTFRDENVIDQILNVAKSYLHLWQHAYQKTYERDDIAFTVFLNIDKILDLREGYSEEDVKCLINAYLNKDVIEMVGGLSYDFGFLHTPDPIRKLALAFKGNEKIFSLVNEKLRNYTKNWRYSKCCGRRILDELGEIAEKTKDEKMIEQAFEILEDENVRKYLCSLPSHIPVNNGVWAYRPRGPVLVYIVNNREYFEKVKKEGIKGFEEVFNEIINPLGTLKYLFPQT